MGPGICTLPLDLPLISVLESLLVHLLALHQKNRGRHQRTLRTRLGQKKRISSTFWKFGKNAREYDELNGLQWCKMRKPQLALGICAGVTGRTYGRFLLASFPVSLQMGSFFWMLRKRLAEKRKRGLVQESHCPDSCLLRLKETAVHQELLATDVL